MDSIMAAAGSSLPNMEGSIESLSSPLTASPLSSVQGHSIDSYHTVGTPEGQGKLVPCNVNMQSESMPNDVDRQQLAMPSRESGQTQAMQPNLGQMKLSVPNKRKASNELSADAEGAQKMSFPNRRVAQASSVDNALSATSASLSNSSGSSASGRKLLPVESTVNKSQSTVIKKNALQQESPKFQAGSHESVRAKLRESLASALAVVSKQQECCLNGKMVGDSANLEPGSDEAACSFRNPYPSGESNDVRNGSQTKEMCGEATQTCNSMGADFRPNFVSSGEEASFWNGPVFKDELFQGNGLSWVSDLNPHISEVKQVENTDKPILMHEAVSSHEKEQTVQSPELLALRIELELYKLFGGVNKKYKEKGRSLLFNLKDRNNPDLREKVMSGEIPPDRLCSMTAEDLASKELSQWRIAKAEELDHMKVLPDSEVNMRRLVKKTHKGEYQVDLDPDVGAPEEIPLGTGVPIQNRSKINGVAASPPSRVEKSKEDQDREIIISSSDVQGLEVMDDVRDLPPIVSLDEFMESLDKEPPIEKLPVDCGRTTESVKGTSELGSESKSPVKPSEFPMEMTSQKTKEVGLESIKPVGGVKSTDSKVDTFVAVHLPKGERVWEGELQLNITSMANFIALYKSGQKACTRGWPGSFEIKGRVKLDAFEKFVEALPMSRSRAIMVSHFVLKEPSTDFERANLIEVVDSYNVDQRLGFAEPISGVELYLCPPRSRTVDIIINHLPRSYTEKLNDIDNGLIGIVVWRKVQIIPSTNSPNCRGQYAENYDNRNVGFANRPAPLPPILYEQPNDDDDDDVPPGFGPPDHRDDDDLPEFSFSGGPNLPISQHSDMRSFPGHGLGSHHPPSRVPSGQVEQMRELVKKYGQNETKPDSGIPLEPWNDDDDDEDGIPEWQPESQPQPHAPRYEPPPPPPPSQNPVMQPAPHFEPPPQPPLPGHNPVMPPPLPTHNLILPPHMRTIQQPPGPSPVRPLQPLQPPMRVHQPGNWWPYGGPNGVVSQPNNRQWPGTLNLPISPSESGRGWKQNGSNYRGF